MFTKSDPLFKISIKQNVETTIQTFYVSKTTSNKSLVSTSLQAIKTDSQLEIIHLKLLVFWTTYFWSLMKQKQSEPFYGRAV